MHSLSIVLIAGLRYFGGVAYVYDGERNVILRHLKHSLEIVLYSSLRICTAPYSTKTEIGSAQKKVFYRRRAILNPELCSGGRKSATCITGYNYNKRGVKAREQGRLLDSAELIAISNYVELPRSLVAGAGATHSRVKELVYLLVTY